MRYQNQLFTLTALLAGCRSAPPGSASETEVTYTAGQRWTRVMGWNARS